MTQLMKDITARAELIEKLSRELGHQCTNAPYANELRRDIGVQYGIICGGVLECVRAGDNAGADEIREVLIRLRSRVRLLEPAFIEDIEDQTRSFMRGKQHA